RALRLVVVDHPLGRDPLRLETGESERIVRLGLVDPVGDPPAFLIELDSLDDPVAPRELPLLLGEPLRRNDLEGERHPRFRVVLDDRAHDQALAGDPELALDEPLELREGHPTLRIDRLRPLAKRSLDLSIRLGVGRPVRALDLRLELDSRRDDVRDERVEDAMRVAVVSIELAGDVDEMAAALSELGHRPYLPGDPLAPCV